ncbi:MAG: transposase [Nitrososphaerales archaeon]
MNKEVRNASERIRQIADDEDCRLLMTIPCTGYYSGLLIKSGIGDINRFPDSWHLCSYAGRVSSTHSSRVVTYHGAITKEGSEYLRWIMTEYVYVQIRTVLESNVSKFYAKLQRRRESKTL